MNQTGFTVEKEFPDADSPALLFEAAPGCLHPVHTMIPFLQQFQLRLREFNGPLLASFFSF